MSNAASGAARADGFLCVGHVSSDGMQLVLVCLSISDFRLQ